MHLSNGVRLGPYEILSLIGAGGMGEVWKARDTRLDRSVAVKILPAEFAQSVQLKLRFEREAKAISQLEHPHICRLYDVGESAAPSSSETVSYLVMELLDGESLADRLARGPLTLAELTRYGAQIAEALDRAHRAGIVHRDLKPGNIMLTKSGAKLLDFGLAKSESSPAGNFDGATEHKPLTQEGTILGTFQYMAPEQLSGEEADPRTDIFALGAVLYEMATGKRAFQGRNKTSLVSQIVAGEPRAIRELLPTTPAALEHIITKCLAKDREERWQSAKDIAEELRWVGEQQSSPGTERAIRGTTPRALIAVAIVAAIAAAAFAGLWWRARTAPRSRFTASLLAPAGTTFNFEFGGIALSPDGNSLAFVANDDEGRPALYVHDFASGQSLHLEGAAQGVKPFWSPDGHSLGFFANGKLKTIDRRGGPAQAIANAPEGRGGAWNDAGTIVYSPDLRDGLFRVEAGGGPSQRLTSLAKGEISHRWPIFLPDQKHLLFLAQRAEGGAHDDPSTIEIVSIEDGRRRALLRANSSVLYASGQVIFWNEGSLLAQPFDARKLTVTGSPIALAERVSYSGLEQAIASVSTEGTLVYDAAGQIGQSRLATTSRNGVNLTIVPYTANFGAPTLSPDGKRIAVSMIDQTEDLFVIDAQRMTRTRLTFDSTDESVPVWSPDGAWIAFRSNRSDGGDVYRKRSNGEGAEEPVFVSPESAAPTDWSPDGRSLLMTVQTSDTSRNSDIWIYSFAERRATPLVQTPSTEMSAMFSPDGRWITYSSNESGRFEVYVQSIDGKGRTQVSLEGAGFPRWRGDGRELFFIGTDGGVRSVEISTDPSLTASAPRLLFTFRQKVATREEASFDVTADGQTFLLNQITANSGSPVTIVKNWPEKLRRD